MPTFSYPFDNLDGFTFWYAPNPPKDIVRPEHNLENTLSGAHALAVHSAPHSLRFHNHWSTWHAGVYRQFIVTPLSLVRAGVWGRVWNTSGGTFPTPSDTNTHPYLRIGIDRNGGIDPASESVTWREMKVYDEWKRVEVQETALQSVVTVFSGFENGRTGQWDLQNMYAYLDDLEVIVGTVVAPPPTDGISAGIVRVEEGTDYWDITRREPKV